MKHIAGIATIAFIAALTSSTVLSQTANPGGAVTAPKAGDDAARQGKGDSRARMRSREHADARECLRFSTNTEIIKCAEKYRHR